MFIVSRLLPKIIKPDLLIQQLFLAGQPGGYIPEQQVQQGLAFPLGVDEDRLAADLHRLSRIQHRRPKIPNLINKMHAKRLLPGPYSAVSNGLDLGYFRVSSFSHGANEISCV